MPRRVTPGVVILGLVAAIPAMAQPAVGDTPTRARAGDGQYISWREHIIDEPATAGVELSGSDGLVMADLDGDGFEDIVSVHESDSEYDSAVVDPNYDVGTDGHVRIAFGSADPDVWTNVTLAEGTDASAAEDAAIADLNGDGHLDVMVAAELAHLIYLENPGGAAARTELWERLILPLSGSMRPTGIDRFLTKDVSQEERRENPVCRCEVDGVSVPERVEPRVGHHGPQKSRLAGRATANGIALRGADLDVTIAVPGLSSWVLGSSASTRRQRPFSRVTPGGIANQSRTREPRGLARAQGPRANDRTSDQG